MTPGRSQNLMSTYSTFSSEMKLRISSELLNTLTDSFERRVAGLLASLLGADAMAAVLPGGHSVVSQRLTDPIGGSPPSHRIR